MALPSTSALRALDAVARLGSVTRAAAELNITRSAVSHQLRFLEQELGFAVVERDGRGVALTPRGESLFLAQRQTGQRLEPIVVDAKTHEIIAPDTTTLVAGSRASKEMRDRIDRVRAKRLAQGRRPEAAP